jgi:hypothetical protein
MDNRMVHAMDCKCISWKPVFAGALTAIGLSFLLNLFSVAIGLTAYTTNAEGVETMVFGGLLGTAIGIIAAMFAAGWIAGYLGQRHCVKRHVGCMYGFLTWCVALIISIFLMSHAVEYVAFYSHFISGSLANMAPPAADKVAETVRTMDTSSVVVSTFILFILFFLSAFACTLGGHCGMRHVCKDQTV